MTLRSDGDQSDSGSKNFANCGSTVQMLSHFQSLSPKSSNLDNKFPSNAEVTCSASVSVLPGLKLEHGPIYIATGISASTHLPILNVVWPPNR
jgi:hypothetical protein